MTVQAANLSAVDLALGSVTLEEFFQLMGPDGFQVMDTYQSRNTVQWVQPLELPANRNSEVELLLTRDGSPLDPGLYFLRIRARELSYDPAPLILVVGASHLTFKLAPTQALVWATDLNTLRPAAEQSLAIYSEAGETLFTGATDAEGVTLADLPPRDNPYETIYAMVSRPGEAGSPPI